MKKVNHYWLDTNLLSLHYRKYDESGEYEDEIIGSTSAEKLNIKPDVPDEDPDLEDYWGKVDKWVSEICPEAVDNYEVN